MKFLHRRAAMWNRWFLRFKATDFFILASGQQTAMWQMVATVKSILDEQCRPAAYKRRHQCRQRCGRDGGACPDSRRRADHRLRRLARNWRKEFGTGHYNFVLETFARCRPNFALRSPARAAPTRVSVAGSGTAAATGVPVKRKFQS